ncbi:hypothetical protein JW758_00790, partial [Candidatus Peregrinibacteria bacterium]|nr:hypothetical protein [Candidatus Peregrinibacteria bacterium]
MKQFISRFLIVVLALSSFFPVSVIAEEKTIESKEVIEKPVTIKKLSSNFIQTSSLMSVAGGLSSGQSSNAEADPKTFLSSFQGDYEVSLFSGSLNYSYPIWVPKGRNGMTPNINLTYSNVDWRYDSPVGYGWSLPINGIYRTPEKGVDTTYTSDHFSADIFGKTEELILIDSTNDIYAPKNESSFIQYTFSGTSWTAVDKKGIKYTFGLSSTARQDDPDNNSRVYKWMLQEVEDTNGNAMVFSYTKRNGAIYPDEIRYTDNDSDLGIFKIKFNLQTRGDYTSYRTGFKVIHDRLVNSIDLKMYQDSSWDTLLTYDLDYEVENNAIYLLDEITVESDTDSLPSTQFDYFDGSEDVEYKKRNGLYKITEPYGGTHTFTYKPASAYRTVSGDSENLLPFIVYTVYEHKAQAGTGEPVYTTTYDYEDGHYFFDDLDSYKREYAGFGKVSVIDPADNVKKYYFHQSQNDPNNDSDDDIGEYDDHISKKGKVYRSEQYDDDENLLKAEINKWSKSTLSDDDPDRERFQVYLDRTTTIDYGENSQSKTKAITYDYDSYGNPEEIIDYGEVTLTNQTGDFTDTGEDKITTDIEYTYDTTDHLLSYPKLKERLDYSDTLISREKIYYDDLSWGQIDEGNMTDKEDYYDASNFVTTQWSYNSYGLITSVTNPRNYSTYYIYDTNTYLYPETIANAKSQETDYGYNNFFGKAVSITDPNDFVTETDYDDFGRIEEQRIKNPSSTMKTIKDYTYNLAVSPPYMEETIYPDNLDNQDNAIEVTKRTYFDGFSRPVQIKTEAEGSSDYIVSSITYNELGQIKEEYLPKTSAILNYETITTSDPKTTYTYDALGRVKTIVNSEGTTANTYNDWWVRVVDANSEQKDYYSDSRGNLIEVKEYLNSTPYSTEYEYSPNNDLVKITDAEDNEKNMTYDFLGRKLTEELLHDSSEQSPNSYTFTYDANGNLSTRTDAESQTITYTYDQLDRVLTENTTEVEYTYDTGTNGIGRLASVVSAGGSKAYEYNIMGQMTEEAVTINNITYETSYTYDLLGNPLSITYPDSSSVLYEYNNAGQMEEIPGYVFDFDYSPIGSVSYIGYVNGVSTTNTYDPDELYRLTEKQTVNSAVDLQNITYAFDAVGNITDIVDSSDTVASKTAEYDYDDLYRLTSAAITNTGNSQNFTRSYSYSINGNISSKSDVGSYTYNNIHPHAVTTVGSTTYTYDDNGSMTGDGTWTHTYDVRNRLVSSTDGNSTITYTYDEGNTRLRKTDGTNTTIYPSKLYEVENDIPRRHIYAGNMKIATVEGVDSAGNMPSDSDLMGYWPFDEGQGVAANDYSGYSNLASLSNGSWANGIAGGAYEWNGTDTASAVSYDSDLQNLWDNGGSTSLWIYAGSDGESNCGYIIAKGNTKWRFRVEYESEGYMKLAFYKDFSGSDGYWVTTGRPIAVDTWHHVVINYDADSISNDPVIYVDSVSQDIAETTAPSGTRVSDSGDDFLIGHHQEGGCTFDGSIDELRLYDAILSVNEINTLYEYISGATNNLVGYWSFDEGQGAVADDYSENSNPAALANGTWTTGISDDTYEWNSSNTTSVVEINDNLSIRDIWDSGGSVSLWMYPHSDGESSTGYIVSKGNAVIWRFRVEQESGGYMKLAFFKDFTDTDGFWITTGRPIVINTWNHVVLNYDSDSASNDPVIYVNTVSQSITETSAPAGTRTTDEGNLYIGQLFNGGSTFDGIIDELRLYDTTLTTDEIDALYDNPSGTTLTTAFHHTDHLSGSNISTDSTGNILELNDYYPYGASRIENRTGD